MSHTHIHIYIYTYHYNPLYTYLWKPVKLVSASVQLLTKMARLAAGLVPHGPHHSRANCYEHSQLLPARLRVHEFPSNSEINSSKRTRPLIHEVRNDPMEVETVVEASFC